MHSHVHYESSFEASVYPLRSRRSHSDEQCDALNLGYAAFAVLPQGFAVNDPEPDMILIMKYE